MLNGPHQHEAILAQSGVLEINNERIEGLVCRCWCGQLFLLATNGDIYEFTPELTD